MKGGRRRDGEEKGGEREGNIGRKRRKRDGGECIPGVKDNGRRNGGEEKEGGREGKMKSRRREGQGGDCVQETKNK